MWMLRWMISGKGPGVSGVELEKGEREGDRPGHNSRLPLEASGYFLVRVFDIHLFRLDMEQVVDIDLA